MWFPDKIFNKMNKPTKKQKNEEYHGVFYWLMHWHSEFKFDIHENVKE